MPNITLLGCGGAAGPSTLITDPFTGVDGTSLATTGWSKYPTSVAWTIQGNQAQGTSGTFNSICTKDAGNANATITGKIKSDKTGWGLIGRASEDGSNHFSGYIAYRNIGGSIQLYKSVVGALSLLGNIIVTVAVGDTVSLAFSGNSITLSCNGVSNTFTDSALNTNTRYGMYFDAGDTYLWDDILVQG